MKRSDYFDSIGCRPKDGNKGIQGKIYYVKVHNGTLSNSEVKSINKALMNRRHQDTEMHTIAKILGGVAFIALGSILFM